MIAGLGNPGKEYEHTRHNVGFEVIDRLSQRYEIPLTERKHRAYCGKGLIGGQKVMLLKPQTFMNLSGESVKSAADFYQIPAEQMIIVHDDVSLEPGQLRIRTKGSAGGHNGMKNIIAQMGTQEFLRVKVGVGAKPERMDLADYVLSHFSKGEWEMMQDAFDEAAEAVAALISDGAEAAMNRFNAKKHVAAEAERECETKTE